MPPPPIIWPKGVEAAVTTFQFVKIPSRLGSTWLVSIMALPRGVSRHMSAVSG
jgi:hypothetical protein